MKILENSELGNNNNNNSNNSNGNGKAHNEPDELHGDPCQDNLVSADHSKRTIRGKDDSVIKKGKSPQHVCWFQKCNKLFGFESPSELNSHIRNMHQYPEDDIRSFRISI